MDEKFSSSNAIKLGWNTFKQNPFLLVGLFVVAMLVRATPFIISILFKITSDIGDSNSSWLGALDLGHVLLTVVHMMVQALVAMGLIKITLKFCDGLKGGFADLFSCFPQTISYLVAAFLYGAIVLVGSVLFIIPGLIWAIQFQFAPYVIVDKGCGPIQSLERSSLITRGNRMNLFIFAILIVLLNMLGILALGIGFLVTLPISCLATTHVYRQLSNAADAKQAATLQTENPTG